MVHYQTNLTKMQYTVICLLWPSLYLERISDKQLQWLLESQDTGFIVYKSYSVLKNA